MPCGDSGINFALIPSIQTGVLVEISEKTVSGLDDLLVHSLNDNEI